MRLHPFALLQERERERKKESERGIIYQPYFLINTYTHLYYKDIRAASERMLNYPNRQMLM